MIKLALNVHTTERMNLRLPSFPFLLVTTLSLILAGAAAAQTEPATESARCRIEEAALMDDIDTARSRGRMLQRRQLSEELVALQARCGSLPPARTREASISRLQGEILELRRELDRAETELRKLRQAL